MQNRFLLALACVVLLLNCGNSGHSARLMAMNDRSSGIDMASDTIIPTADSLQKVKEETQETEAGSVPIDAQKSAIPVSRKEDNKTVAYLMGKFDYTQHKGFVLVPKPYTDREGMYLRKETYAAFVKMYQAARREGITLTIISSTRNFYRQKEIWEGKWARFATETPDPVDRARRILEYSSMPGSSRHHWGTDIDLNDLENHAFEAGGPHEKMYSWLTKNAHRFGFGQPYTPKGPDRPEGYYEEKWHWSYLPLSKPLLQQYKDMISDADITGFTGAEMASKIGIVQNYVLGISPTCK